MFTYFFCFLQEIAYLKIMPYPDVRPRTGVVGQHVPSLVAKEFQWGRELFWFLKKPKCWDATGKWSREKCALLPFHYVKVVTFPQWANLVQNYPQMVLLVFWLNVICIILYVTCPNVNFTYFTRTTVCILMVFYKCPF